MSILALTYTPNVWKKILSFRFESRLYTVTYTPDPAVVEFVLLGKCSDNIGPTVEGSGFVKVILADSILIYFRLIKNNF
jgi:hypothetical protein